MMKLDYSGGEVLVSDGLSHALLEYSARIARAGGSQNLRIPVLTLDGVRGDAEVVVGPASQLLSSPTDEPHIDLDDASVIASIQALTKSIGPPHAVPLTDSNVQGDGDREI